MPLPLNPSQPKRAGVHNKDNVYFYVKLFDKC